MPVFPCSFDRETNGLPVAGESTASGSSSPLVKLQGFADEIGISRREASDLLGVVLKHLRQHNPTVSKTLFYVAGLRSMSRFAQYRRRLGGAGRRCAMPAREWAASQSHVDREVDPETGARVAAAVDELPDNLGQIYRLLTIDQKRYSEIADQLGMPVESVRAQAFRAKEILRGRLASVLMNMG